MHVLVLSTGNPILELALTAAGHTVTQLIPTSGAARNTHAFTGNAFTTAHWDDLDALDELEPHLPPIDAVTTIDEQCIVAAAYLRQLRKLPGLTLDAAHAYTDKALMKDRLAAHGLPVAGHRVVEHADQIPGAAAELGWPVLVKPRGGLGSVNTFVIRDEKHLALLKNDGAFDSRAKDSTGRFTAGHALDSLHESVNGFLVEQYLDLAGESFCDLYLHDGKLLLAVPGRYDHPLLQTVGSSSHDTVLPPDHPDAPPIIALAHRAATALGAQTGVVHCELLTTTDGKTYIGEAAARPGGGCITELAARMYSFDLASVLADLAVNHVPRLNSEHRYAALTAVMVTAPPGIVASVALKADIEKRHGVLDADIRLTPGQPVPASVGTLTLAGRVLYVPDDLAQLDREVRELREALAIRVTATA